MARSLRLSPALLVLGSFLAASLASCSRGDKTQGPRPVAVKLERVKARFLLRPLVFFGKTEPLDQSNLAFQLSGIVSKIEVEEGEFVKEGDILANLDKESTKLTVALQRARVREASVAYRKLRRGYRSEVVSQSQAAYRQAQALYRKAKADYERVIPLKKQQLISRSQFAQYLSAYRSAEAAMLKARSNYQMHRVGYEKEDIETARVKASQAVTNLRLARKQLRDAALRAPFAGVVAKKLIAVGEIVSGQRAAFQLMDLRRIKIQLGVPERLVGKLRVGQKAYVNTGRMRPMPLEQLISGKLKTKGVVLDSATLTYPVEVLVDNPVVRKEGKRITYKILPGRVVSVMFLTSSPARRTTLPLAAILDDGRERAVFVSDKNTAKRVKVEVGKTHLNRVEVTLPNGSPLPDDTLVVTSGQHQLTSGRRLFVVKTVDSPSGGPFPPR